jgi:hypothetical protein
MRFYISCLAFCMLLSNRKILLLEVESHYLFAKRIHLNPGLCRNDEKVDFDTFDNQYNEQSVQESEIPIQQPPGM